MAKKPTLRARKDTTRPLTVLLTERQFDSLKAAAESEDRAMSRYVSRLLFKDLMEKNFLSYEEAYPEVAEYRKALASDDEDGATETE